MRECIRTLRDLYANPWTPNMSQVMIKSDLCGDAKLT